MLHQVAVGPVRVTNQEELVAFFALLAKQPEGFPGARSLQYSHDTITRVPRRPPKGKKPTVAFNYLWGDWSGISFWF